VAIMPNQLDAIRADEEESSGAKNGYILAFIMTKPLTFDLLFHWNPKDEMALLDADAQIVLQPPIFRTQREEAVTVTNVCTHIGEVRTQVSRLHEELDQVLKMAEEKFSEVEKLRESYLSRRG
jgi:hypothetical protein